MSDKCILDPERDCNGSKRASYLNEQILRELEEHKTRSHETHTQIFERLNKLETSSAELKTQYNAIMDKLNDLSLRITDMISRVTNIERKPAKRWEGTVDKIITVIVGGLIGALLVKLGLPGG